jgi:hypothetical protein
MKAHPYIKRVILRVASARRRGLKIRLFVGKARNEKQLRLAWRIIHSIRY